MKDSEKLAKLQELMQQGHSFEDSFALVSKIHQKEESNAAAASAVTTLEEVSVELTETKSSEESSTMNKEGMLSKPAGKSESKGNNEEEHQLSEEINSDKILIGEQHHIPKARSYLIKQILEGKLDGYKIAFELDGNTKSVILGDEKLKPYEVCKDYIFDLYAGQDSLEKGNLLASTIFPTVDKANSRGMEEANKHFTIALTSNKTTEIANEKSPLSISDVARAIIVRNIEISKIVGEKRFLSPVMIDYRSPISDASQRLSDIESHNTRNKYMAKEFSQHNQIVLIVGNTHVLGRDGDNIVGIVGLLPNMNIEVKDMTISRRDDRTDIQISYDEEVTLEKQKALEIRSALFQKCGMYGIETEDRLQALEESSRGSDDGHISVSFPTTTESSSSVQAQIGESIGARTGHSQSFSAGGTNSGSLKSDTSREAELSPRTLSGDSGKEKSGTGTTEGASATSSAMARALDEYEANRTNTSLTAAGDAAAAASSSNQLTPQALEKEKYQKAFSTIEKLSMTLEQAEEQGQGNNLTTGGRK